MLKFSKVFLVQILLCFFYLIFSFHLKADDNIISGPSIDFSWDSDYNHYYNSEKKGFVLDAPTTGSVLTHSTITGTDNDDTLIFSQSGDAFGKHEIDNLNLKGGYNKLIFEAHTGLSGDSKTVSSYINISEISMAKGVQIDYLGLNYTNYGLKMEFNGCAIAEDGSCSTDSSSPSNNDDEILIKEFKLFSSSSSLKGTFNVTGRVHFSGDAILSNNSETITLNNNSAIQADKGLFLSGGNDTLKLGSNSFFIGDLDTGVGNDTVEIGVNSKITGNVTFGSGNNVLNILSGSFDEKGNPILSTVSSGVITMAKGNNVINIGNNVDFSFISIFSGDSDDIINIGENNTFTGGTGAASTNVNTGAGDDVINIGKNSTITGEFNLGDGDDKMVFNLNQGNDKNKPKITIEGTLDGGAGNNSLQIVGNGNVIFNTSNALNNFNTIDVGQGYMTFSNPLTFNKGSTLNLNVKILPDSNKDVKRLQFNGLVDFNNSYIDLTFTGVSQYLHEKNTYYNVNLISVGTRTDNNYFNKFEDINLEGINFDSATYKIENKVNNNTLTINLKKCATFEEVVTGKSECTKEPQQATNKDYIIGIANYLDQLLEKENIGEEYYDILDDLAMMNKEDLEKTLEGFSPVKSETLLNINQEVANNFKSLIFNSKPYKISKNELSVWSEYSYINLNLDETHLSQGVKSTGNVFTGGIEYNFTNNFKLGAAIGYNKNNIEATTSVYNGNSSNNYYALYSFYSFTNNLVLRTNFSLVQGNFDITRYRNIEHNSPIKLNPDINQMDFNSVLQYKIKLNNYMLTPYLNLGYSKATLEAYNEEGDIHYNVDSTNGNFLSGGVGLNAITVKSLGNGKAIIPSVQLGLYTLFQDIGDTVARFADFSGDELPISIPAETYGKLTLKASAGFSYIMNSYSTLDVNLNTTQGSSISSYGATAALKILL